MNEAILYDYRPFTKREEFFNTILHGFGFVMSIIGFIALIWQAGHAGGGLNLASALVYGISVLILYASSTLYHSLSRTTAKRIFQILDHSSIYLMIAGSVISILIAYGFDSTDDYIRLSVIIIFSVLGMISELFLPRTKFVSVLIYTLLGVFFGMLIYPEVVSFGDSALWLVGLSGISFLLGTPFYILKRFRYFHVIWHLFVLIGSGIYWWFIMFTVLS